MWAFMQHTPGHYAVLRQQSCSWQSASSRLNLFVKLFKYSRWQCVRELCGDDVDGAVVGAAAEVLPPPAVAHANRLHLGEALWQQ
jgi:hypothetical protein